MAASATQQYEYARERYAALGIDTESALEKLKTIPISLHCWQGDDVGGFETDAAELGGGIAVTGNYPGKANTPEQLRSDLDKVYSLLPGNHRLNRHAFYGEFGGKTVDRDAFEDTHFQNWIDWAKANNHGLDFNPTFFAHEKADDGFTLARTSLAPMGAILVVDWYLSGRMGFQKFYAEKINTVFNPIVLIAWAVPVAIALYLIKEQGIASWFCILPCWIACGLIYVLLSKVMQKPIPQT
jgi:hypothetical protein